MSEGLIIAAVALALLAVNIIVLNEYARTNRELMDIMEDMINRVIKLEDKQDEQDN